MVSGGHERDGSLVRAGTSWSLIAGGRSYEISFGEPRGGEALVHVNGVAVTVAMPGRRAGVKTDVASDGAAQILAPMPGRVVKVLVKKGDRVAARQGLVVVEAMKMENELRSPKDGVVTDVRAVEGGTVEARSVLITVE